MLYLNLLKRFIYGELFVLSMKHTLKITIILVILFFVSQVMGLFIVSKYIDIEKSKEAGIVVPKELAVGNQVFERPPGQGLVAYVVLAIILGTLIVLFLVKFKAVRIWKLWFFFSVWFLLSIALAPFVSKTFAWILALVLALLKVLRPSVIIHNITELFVYGGLAAVIVPIPGFKVWHVIILLGIISIYDMIAVWKIKHMITLAKFQTSSKVFAGLLIPYKRKESEKIKRIKVTKAEKVVPAEESVSNAILGGGDIGFPLVFAGVVMRDLFITNSFMTGFLKALIIPFFVSIALLILFLQSKKDKFYPAMPFLSIGCLVGYGVLQLF
jgi:presenilin-like A22 family membrane protease